MQKPIRVIQMGLGPLGRMLTPFLAERNHLQIVGAVDIDPKIIGRDLGELGTSPQPLGIKVSKNLTEAAQAGADVVVMTTVSGLSDLFPALEEAGENGLHVVSTCEELSYPWQAQTDLAQKIDTLAKAKKIVVLGTGVNPGFLMDFLPTAMTAVCRDVRKIWVGRMQDASFRRLPFQQKIGAGLTAEEFRKRVARGKIRHVGLIESIHMIAARMGWKLDRAEETIEPVIAEEMLTGTGYTIEPGMAAGVDQRGHGYQGKEEVLTLEFRAAVGEKEPRDEIRIDGVPPVHLTVPGGINGDIATCAVVVNAIPTAVHSHAGLRTMVDIRPVSFFR